MLYKWSWVQIPLRPIFCSYFKKSFSSEYHIYQFIPLKLCDYLKKNFNQNKRGDYRRQQLK